MTFDGMKVRIDKDIAPIIEMMWFLGIRTISSCHGHCSFECSHKINIYKDEDGFTVHSPILTDHCHDSVWIVFEQAHDIEKFYDTIAEYSDEGKSAKTATMYDHILGHYRNKNKRDVWCTQFYARNYGVKGHWGKPIINGKRLTYECWIEDDCKKNNFIVQPQLTFPRKHIEYIKSKLQEALNKKSKSKSKNSRSN
jgi:hypothetical protein